MIKSMEWTKPLDKWVDEEFKKHGTAGIEPYCSVDFCFAEEQDGELLGVVAGHCTYAEVYIGTLVVKQETRGQGIGSRLLRYVEEQFTGKGYEVLTLTTYRYQAPEFYKKNGFIEEFVRESAQNPNLSKYYFSKKLKP